MIYFLGGGNMATAIIAGMRSKGSDDICVVERNLEKQQALAEKYAVKTTDRLPEISADDVLVLAVKPKDMQATLQEVNTQGALVLSVAAGLTVATLSRYLNGATRIIRIMPNTPAQVGLGVAGMYAAEHISDADKQRAENIMRSSGEVVWLPEENDLHRITGISGSGPAYVFYFLAALQQAAEEQGFDAETAQRLSLATFKGAVALAEVSREDFHQLQQNVTSKGGTTFEAIAVFERGNINSTIREGVRACVARSQEISREFD